MCVGASITDAFLKDPYGPLIELIPDRGFNAGRAIPFNPPSRNGELTLGKQPEIPDIQRARMSLRMLDRVPVIDAALVAFGDDLKERLCATLVQGASTLIRRSIKFLGSDNA